MTAPKDGMADLVIGALAGGIIQNTKVHINLSQNAIVTTEDKVRLCLYNYLSRMERRNAWVAPAGIFITLVVTLISTKFQDVILDAPTWRALFILSGIVAALWLIRTLVQANRAPSMDDVIRDMKRASEEAAGPPVQTGGAGAGA
jgi:hypothetical protein